VYTARAPIEPDLQERQINLYTRLLQENQKEKQIDRFKINVSNPKKKDKNYISAMVKL